MSRFDEIAQIYDHRLPLLRSPEIWEQTLRMTSSFWSLNFCEAMLLTLQNPKAEMCGTIDQWNNIGRYIRRGEHSTAVFRSRTDTQLMYLFDVRQTYGKAYNSKWKLSERMADGIVGKFNSENAENAVSFEDYLQKSLDKNIDLVYNYNSKLNNAISNDPRTAAFIRTSAEFICMTRCGIPGDSDFSDVAKINSDLSIVEIGNAATALAQAVLREIDGIIRRKEYERYEAGICGRHLRYPIRGRSERTVPPEIHELRQGADDSAGAQGGRPDERTRPDSAGHGEHQRTVPPNLEGNREESRENSEQHNTLSAGENLPQPGLLREREPADGDRHDGAGSRLGIPADERSVAGGGSPEPGEPVGDPENLDEPDDEELEEMVSDDESDTISVFTDIPEEISPDSDYAQKLLEDEIIRGSGFSNGKFRISEYVSENSPSKDELAKFLKNEYGIGGSSRNDDPVSFSNHDGKGIELVLSNRQVIRFNWKKVAEAVRSAVNSGKYITESDIETRRRMTLFDAQRFAIHTELLLNQKRAVVNDYRELPDGRTEKVFNAKETILARECQDKIEQAFHDWVMADKDRIQIIEDRFNALFNNIKPRTYNGDYITIPGMNPNLTLRPHQKNVIARIAATGTCMMAHEVGAGKTAAMGAAGMYLKSIGACTKPMYVVPNAVVAQFGEELQRFFPEAKILVATSKDMEKSQRRRIPSADEIF